MGGLEPKTQDSKQFDSNDTMGETGGGG